MFRLIKTWLESKIKPVICLGGYEYPIDEFLGYSDEQVKSLLISAGSTQEQADKTVIFLETLKEPKTTEDKNKRPQKSESVDYEELIRKLRAFQKSEVLARMNEIFND